MFLADRWVKETGCREAPALYLRRKQQAIAKVKAASMSLVTAAKSILSPTLKRLMSKTGDEYSIIGAIHLPCQYHDADVVVNGTKAYC